MYCFEFQEWNLHYFISFKKMYILQMSSISNIASTVQLLAVNMESSNPLALFTCCLKTWRRYPVTICELEPIKVKIFATVLHLSPLVYIGIIVFIKKREETVIIGRIVSDSPQYVWPEGGIEGVLFCCRFWESVLLVSWYLSV